MLTPSLVLRATPSSNKDQILGSFGLEPHQASNLHAKHAPFPLNYLAHARQKLELEATALP